ncbi:MAG TPA: glycosyltransferase [Vicinamibacterales bacterium]|nr:glycosyltransferase [Vicinamibacterales bacterium]
MLVSVQISTHNRCESLRRCLTSLFSITTARELFEVVVVDDGSEDGTAEMVARLSPPYTLRYVHQAHAGLARARNAGILAARGEIVLFLDDDVLATPSLIDAHAHTHGSNAGAAVVNGTVRHVEAPVVPRTPKARLADFSSSFFWTCNASVRRSDLLAAGLFDEAFTEYGWEDLEFGDRLRRLGLRRRRSAGAVVYHVKPRWRGSDLPRLLSQAEASGRSAVLYVRKAPSWRARLSTGISPVRMRANLWAAKCEPLWRRLACRDGDGEMRGAARLGAWLLQRAHYFRAIEGELCHPI